MTQTRIHSLANCGPTKSLRSTEPYMSQPKRSEELRHLCPARKRTWVRESTQSARPDSRNYSSRGQQLSGVR
jgi:hypothetical protein